MNDEDMCLVCDTIGKVTEARIGIEDHGILTFEIMINFGGMYQGFGGYNLQCPRAFEIIKGVLAAFNVCWWDQIAGRIVQVERENGLIRRLVPLPFEGGKSLDMRDFEKEDK